MNDERILFWKENILQKSKWLFHMFFVLVKKKRVTKEIGEKGRCFQYFLPLFTCSTTSNRSRVWMLMILLFLFVTYWRVVSESQDFMQYFLYKDSHRTSRFSLLCFVIFIGKYLFQRENSFEWRPTFQRVSYSEPFLNNIEEIEYDQTIEVVSSTSHRTFNVKHFQSISYCLYTVSHCKLDWWFSNVFSIDLCNQLTVYLREKKCGYTGKYNRNSSNTFTVQSGPVPIVFSTMTSSIVSD